MARVQRRARAERLGRTRFYGSVVPADSFREDVIEGLSQPQKSLSPKYFYDAEGSRLFDRICRLPAYYPTRAELALTHTRSLASFWTMILLPSNDLIHAGTSTIKLPLKITAPNSPCGFSFGVATVT